MGRDMSLEEAYVSLFRYKNVEGSAVTEKQADAAREVLKDAWSGEKRRSVSIYLREPDHKATVDFVRRLTDGRITNPREVPTFEWTDGWIDAEGTPVAITSHAYHPRGQDLKRAIEFAEQAGLEMRIQGYGSWKNAGHAVIIEYERKPTPPDEPRVIEADLPPVKHPRTTVK